MPARIYAITLLVAPAFLSAAQDRPYNTIAILRALLEDARANSNGYWTLRLATQLSVALLAADEPAETIHVLDDVLSAASSTGFYQWIGCRPGDCCMIGSARSRSSLG